MKRPILLSCVVFACCCLMAGIGWLIFGALSQPVHKMEQTDSSHEGYRRTTLTNGGVVYVHDFEEYALAAFGEGTREKIGNLPLGGFEDTGIYSIPGQSPSAYVLEFDPMYEIVYRNIEHPPFDWRTASFEMMRLIFPSRNPKETTDPRVIQDILTALTRDEGKFLPFHEDGMYPGYENYRLMSFSPEIDGLAYVFGVHIGTDGIIYLAENPIANQWFPAGSIFTNWANSP